MRRLTRATAPLLLPSSFAATALPHMHWFTDSSNEQPHNLLASSILAVNHMVIEHKARLLGSLDPNMLGIPSKLLKRTPCQPSTMRTLSVSVDIGLSGLQQLIEQPSQGPKWPANIWFGGYWWQFGFHAGDHRVGLLARCSLQADRKQAFPVPCAIVGSLRVEAPTVPHMQYKHIMCMEDAAGMQGFPLYTVSGWHAEEWASRTEAGKLKVVIVIADLQ